MSFLDELKKLTRPYDDEDDDFLDEDEQESARQEKSRSNPFAGFGGESSAAPVQSAPQPRAQRPKEGKVVSLGGEHPLQVVLTKPERFETAAEIADHLRDQRAVLVNLENTPKDVTRRLVDFLSGVAYAIDGKVKKVAANTYIITPPNVDLVGDLMDELESSGMYF